MMGEITYDEYVDYQVKTLKDKYPRLKFKIKKEEEEEKKENSNELKVITNIRQAETLTDEQLTQREAGKSSDYI
jgi:hypothetical protein